MTSALKTHIGLWAQRPGHPEHYVESEIEQRIVTRCGRQMDQLGSDGPLTYAKHAADPCQQCRRRRRA